jgi:hypothetical protein
MKLWHLHTDASQDLADTVASGIFHQCVTFSQGGFFGLVLSRYSCEFAELVVVRDALRAAGQRAEIVDYC